MNNYDSKMAKITLSDSERGVGFLKFIAKFLFTLFLFTSPLMFVIGLPGIYTGGWPVWVGTVVSITGLVIFLLIITYSVAKDTIKRKEGDRFITKTNLAVIAFVGLCEIIVSIIPLIQEDVIALSILRLFTAKLFFFWPGSPPFLAGICFTTPVVAKLGIFSNDIHPPGIALKTENFVRRYQDIKNIITHRAFSSVQIDNLNQGPFHSTSFHHFSSIHFPAYCL